MTGWSLFFTLLGITVMAMQLFRIIDAIERPAKRRNYRRRAVAAR